MATCAYCSVNKATDSVKQVIDGVLQDIPVCEACAAKQVAACGLTVNDLLFGASEGQRQADVPGMRRTSCLDCHMTWSDFSKTQRLGCPTCYTSFESLLLPIIEDMHRADTHTGRKPAGDKIRQEMKRLKQALEASIETQDFEQAASLRDRIHALEVSQLEAVSHG